MMNSQYHPSSSSAASAAGGGAANRRTDCKHPLLIDDRFEESLIYDYFNKQQQQKQQNEINNATTPKTTKPTKSILKKPAATAVAAASRSRSSAAASTRDGERGGSTRSFRACFSKKTSQTRSASQIGTRTSRSTTSNQTSRNHHQQHQHDQMMLDAEEMDSLKIFTATTELIKIYTARVQRAAKLTVGPYLFEIMAQLDSSIVDEGEEASKKLFSIVDQHGRMNCVFYEIDRPMPRIVRGSWIRCVGKYSLKESILKCMSVRLATQDELCQFGFLVNQTSTHIKAKYLK